MSVWGLPTSLNVGGIDYEIRTDYRVILDILNALGDPDLFEPDASEEEKGYVQCEVMLKILYVDYENIPLDKWQEASDKAGEFISCGIEPSKKKSLRLMDWEQDAPILSPALSKSLGVEDVRALPYVHWWTFFGAYLGIGDGLFSQVIYIREKKAKHKKLEKWEREFYNANKEIIDLKKKYTEEERKEQAEVEAFFKEWGG